MVCEAGHSFCRDCVTAIDLCPFCQEDMCPASLEAAEGVPSTCPRDFGDVLNYNI